LIKQDHIKRLLIFLPLIYFGCDEINQKSDYSIYASVDTTFTVNSQVINSVAFTHFFELHPNYVENYSKSILTESFPQLDTTLVIKDNKGRDAVYIFKYKNNNGWNIISGDNRFHPILAYNNNGMATLDINKNPGLKYWMNDIIQQIDYYDQNGIGQSERIKYQWDKYITPSKVLNPSKNEPPEDPTCPPSLEVWAGPWNYQTNDYDGFTSLSWNQTAGFNYYSPDDFCEPNYSIYCNKYPAGCGPVAIGMLMKYYQSPSSYIFNGSPRTLSYSIMPNYITPYQVDCNSPSTGVEEVAAFLKFVAGKYASYWCFEVQVPFYYSSKSATALYPNNIRQTFSDWGYSYPGNKIDYSSNIYRLTENLKLRKPVIFSGSSCDVCLWDAHIWLCEGLKEYHDEICSTWAWLYMNWGWGGLDNGWYAISNSYTGGGTNFNNANMKIVVDIHP